MVPWPIAALSLCYAAIAASSAATIWKVWQQQLERSVVWPVTWGLLSAILVIGLALLKPWARRLAIWCSILMLLGALGAAWIAIAQTKPEPIRSLVATALASTQLVVIRYLTRPHVKAWFENAIQLRNQ